MSLYRTTRMFCVFVCLSVHFNFSVKFRLGFLTFCCNQWSSWVFFPFSLLQDPFSLFSNSRFFSSILFGRTSIRLYFFFFGYMICSVVIVIFAASPPYWKPSDFNVRLCLALLDFSLYLYNSFIPRTTLTHSALSSLLPLCLYHSYGPSFCLGHPSVGLPGSDLLHSGWDSWFTRQSSGKAFGVRS